MGGIRARRGTAGGQARSRVLLGDAHGRRAGSAPLEGGPPLRGGGEASGRSAADALDADRARRPQADAPDRGVPGRAPVRADRPGDGSPRSGARQWQARSGDRCPTAVRAPARQRPSLNRASGIVVGGYGPAPRTRLRWPRHRMRLLAAMRQPDEPMSLVLAGHPSNESSRGVVDAWVAGEALNAEGPVVARGLACVGPLLRPSEP